MVFPQPTIFISYRRPFNFSTARAIFMDLHQHGYDVFMDTESINNERFETIILAEIAARGHFLVVLTPSTLEGCQEPDDWLHREIECAMELRRNIVPILVDDFRFDDTAYAYLTGRLRDLPRYNGLSLRQDYFDAAMERLRTRFLKQPVLGDIIPVLPQNAPEVETKIIQIFLCHASEDKPQVREIYHQLKAAGFTPWLDEIDILPGQNWNYEIEQALENSDFVLVFLSTRSVKKIGYVQREFKRALERSEDMPEGFIHTIPVKLDDCTAPRQFRHHQWAKLYEEGAFDTVVRALRHGLQQRRQPVPQPLTESAGKEHHLEDRSSDSRQGNTYAEEDILGLIPYSLSSAVNDHKLERTLDTFSLVQENLSVHKYTRREIDNLAPSQRKKLFTAAPEMEAWWRGKSPENGAWTLFRLQGGMWLSKEQVGAISSEHRNIVWNIPGLLDWYMQDLVF